SATVVGICNLQVAYDTGRPTGYATSWLHDVPAELLSLSPSLSIRGAVIRQGYGGSYEAVDGTRDRRDRCRVSRLRQRGQTVEASGGDRGDDETGLPGTPRRHHRRG